MILPSLALLDHVRRPAGRARDDEQRREHRGRHAHHVVADTAENQSRFGNIFFASHITVSRRSAMSNIFMSPAALRQLARDFLDHLVARVGDRVDRMAEADDDFLVRRRAGGCRLRLRPGVS